MPAQLNAFMLGIFITVCSASAALGAVMAAEKYLPWDRNLSAPTGAALLASGGMILLDHL